MLSFFELCAGWKNGKNVGLCGRCGLLAVVSRGARPLPRYYVHLLVVLMGLMVYGPAITTTTTVQPSANPKMTNLVFVQRKGQNGSEHWTGSSWVKYTKQTQSDGGFYGCWIKFISGSGFISNEANTNVYLVDLIGNLCFRLISVFNHEWMPTQKCRKWKSPIKSSFVIYYIGPADRLRFFLHSFLG